MTIRKSLVWFGVLVVLAGCGSSKDKELVGHYKTVVTAAPGHEKALSIQMVNGATENQTLDLREDKTFTLINVYEFEGTWEWTGTRLSLTVSKMSSAPGSGPTGFTDVAASSKPMILMVTRDGKLVAEQPVGRVDASVSFVKDPK